MKRENAFFEEMKKVGHAWDDERRARLEQRREIEKTYGYCSEEYSNWIAENKDIPFPFTDGANKAYRAWATQTSSSFRISFGTERLRILLTPSARQASRSSPTQAKAQP